jgi:hypothetical protein
MMDEARRAQIPPGIPVVLITAGVPWWPQEEASRAWRAAHDTIIARDPGRRRLVVAAGVGHGIPSSRPDLVVSVVSQVVTRGRASNGGPTA